MKYILSRETARRFRGVARKCQVGGTRGLDPPVLISVAPSQLTMFANFPDVSLALKETTEGFQAGTAIVPISILDHRGDAVDLGILLGSLKHKPLSKESEELVPPALPSEMGIMSKEFLTAMHEAGKSASREELKSGMVRMQLRGAAGEVNGTDGKQGLIQAGFRLPFEEDVLIPAIPVFGLKELSMQEDVKVGRTATHIVVVAGPWTVWLQIDTERRFPRIADAIPRARSQTVLDFDDAEVAELLTVIESLTRQDNLDPTVTFDLKHCSCVRARNDEQSPVLYVPLVKSRITGPNVLVASNAFHIRRVLESGFRQIRFMGSERTWVAVDDKRTFLSAPLGPEAAIPADNPIPAPRHEVAVPSASNGVVSHVLSNGVAHSAPTNGLAGIESLPNRLPSQAQNLVVAGHPVLNGHVQAPLSVDPLELLKEAEALMTATVDLHTKACRLVNALRGVGKDRRPVENALATLKTIRL